MTQILVKKILLINIFFVLSISLANITRAGSMGSTIEDQIPIQIFKAMVVAYDVFKSKKIEESDYYISYLEHNGTAIFIFSQKTLNNKTRGNTTKELIFEVNVNLEKMKVVGSSFAR